MKFDDIEGKVKTYSPDGNIILEPREKLIEYHSGLLHRGWVKYKLGWRTIMFKGYGNFNLTDKRLIYIEVPEYIQKIHTFNIDHELGDFGGWDYHAHRMRRAARLQAMMFFELRYDEIKQFKHKDDLSTIFVDDGSHKYKVIVENKIAKYVESVWKKLQPIKL
jgi:hypothetical protein